MQGHALGPNHRPGEGRTVLFVTATNFLKLSGSSRWLYSKGWLWVSFLLKDFTESALVILIWLLFSCGEKNGTLLLRPSCHDFWTTLVKKSNGFCRSVLDAEITVVTTDNNRRKKNKGNKKIAVCPLLSGLLRAQCWLWPPWEVVFLHGWVYRHP